VGALPAREFVRAVRDFSREHELLPAGARVVAGVSGGPDSIALLLALHELAGPLRLTLHAGHLNHGLRRGAATDARFVAAAAAKLGVPCTVGAADVAALARRRRMSVEEAGRLARYSFLYRLARKTGSPVVAVGHHADDQAETVLMRLLRGAASTGLAGMAERRDLRDPLAARPVRAQPVALVRPLLGRTRAEILAYLRWRKAAWREDPTNASPSHLRNAIRHHLLPLLERRYSPGVRPALARAAATLGREDALLADLAARAQVKAAGVAPRGGAALKVTALRKLPPPVLYRVLHGAAVAAGADPRRLAQSHLDALILLLRGAGGEAHLPGCRASRRGAVLVLRPARR